MEKNKPVQTEKCKIKDPIKIGEDILIKVFRNYCPYADKVLIKLANPESKTAGMSCSDCPLIIKNSCPFFKVSNIA